MRLVCSSVASNNLFLNSAGKTDVAMLTSTVANPVLRSLRDTLSTEVPREQNACETHC